MQLASIWSRDMGAALHAQVKTFGPNTHVGYWTGGNDKATEGIWTWADGAAWAAVANWGTGQPDNSVNQDCMYVRRDSNGDGLWDDVGCDNDLDTLYPLCASACERVAARRMPCNMRVRTAAARTGLPVLRRASLPGAQPHLLAPQ
jgi:hypothetical protein